MQKVRQKQYGEDILSQEMENDKTYEDVLKEELLGALILEKIIAKELDKMNIPVTDKK